MSTRVWIRRAYDPPTHNDGQRVLVDRVWPRGVSKESLRLTEWMREVAPSDALRRWFGHQPDRYPEFRRKYRAELKGHRAELDDLVARARERRVTLVYGAHDTEHNQAVVLREVLDARLAKG